MLKTLRKNRKGIFGVVLVVVICFTMAGFGIDAFTSSSQRAPAVRIDKTEISMQEYYRKYEQLQNVFRRQFGEQYARIAPMLNLEQQTAEQLVRNTLLERVSTELSLTASDKAIRDKVLSIDFLQGNPTQDGYRALLQALRMSEAELKKQISFELIDQQVRSVLSDLNPPSELELQKIAREEGRKVKFNTLEFSPVDFESKVNIDDNEALKAHYVDTAEQYRKPRSVRFDAVAFKPQDFLEKVEVSEEDLTQGYEERKAQYFTDKRISFRQIVFKKQTSASSSLENMVEGQNSDPHQAENLAKKAKADETLARLKAGEDFAEVAKQVSEDPTSAVNGGSIGWATLESLSPALRAAVNELDVGDQSTIIETMDSYYIVLVEGQEDRRQQTLEEVKDRVLAELKQELAPDYAQAAAESFLQTVKQKPSVADTFQSLAQAANYKVLSSGKLLTRLEGTAELPAQLAEEAAVLSPNQQELISVGANTFVVEVIETKDSYVPEFEEAKSEVQANYKRSKAKELAKQAAEQGLKSLQEAKVQTLEEVAKVNALKIGTTSESTKLSLQQPPFQDPEVKRAALALNTDKPRSQTLASSGDRFYLFELVSEQFPTEEEQKTLLKAAAEKETTLAGTRIVEALLSTLKADAEIWTNPDLEKKRG